MATPIKYGKLDVSTPYTYMRYKPKNKGDVDKISQALQKMTGYAAMGPFTTDSCSPLSTAG